ncbi:MAG: chemotaxis response regulator protein-glutamate methylesterase [Chloroflexi bacterium]|nr:MAG: chemotaxis response regulator protein-glutamate methylesterase [Chloroflexota bacterium]
MAVRVLVVDDSAFMRRVIADAIASQPDMEVAGVAHNGLDALLKVEQLQPDVVTLDVEMPDMDGLTALRHLMARYPRPVVMLSSQTQHGAITTLRALSIGAVDFVAKPSGAISLDFSRVREELLQKIRGAALARVRAQVASTRRTPEATRVPRAKYPGAFEHLVVIGCSTGGPRALAALVPELPAEAPTAYLIVQHMPAGFTRSLAERLDASGPIAVREAVAGDRLEGGTALVAPGDYHLRLSPSGAVELDQAARVHGVRPSVDVALESVSERFGSKTVAVILTGMGQDGAAGAAVVRQAGGYVLAEDESTCVVWGMPRAVVERGLAHRVAPLDGIAEAIASIVSARTVSVR